MHADHNDENMDEFMKYLTRAALPATVRRCTDREDVDVDIEKGGPLLNPENTKRSSDKHREKKKAAVKKMERVQDVKEVDEAEE